MNTNTTNKDNAILIINRHTCPNSSKIQIQAHELYLDDMTSQAYPRMVGDDLTLFRHHERVIMVDVQKVSQLDNINVVKAS